MDFAKLIFYVSCLFCHCLPVHSRRNHDRYNVERNPALINWMKNYGYIPEYTKVPKARISNEAIKFFKIIHNVSSHDNGGSIIDKPRCGNPDFKFGNDFRDHRRSNPSLIRRKYIRSISVSDRLSSRLRYWNKSELVWDVKGFSIMQTMSKHQIEEQISKAVKDWTPHLPFRMRRAFAGETADIQISFEYRDHGDGYEFDGPGGVVGHAFAPLDGRVHIDADELFTDQYEHDLGQFNLRFVVAHEIGHAIGLSHSTIRGSIMFPFYSQLSSNYEISIDDQNAIRALYGIRPEISDRKLTGSKPWCTSMMDAAATGAGNVLYIFEYNIVFIFKFKVRRAIRTPIQTLFPSLENNIMAAVFSESSGYLYFFKGWHIWKYIGTRLLKDYPRIVEGELAPFNPHGAIYHRGKIYLLKGNILYQFDELRGQVTGYSAVFPIDQLILGAPHNISRLFTHRDHHFILTEKYVYVYDANHGVMLEGYPRLRSKDWLLC
ncbi:hypothetical protein GJ496_002531 [Pomphorhynchus laevis]|nr:hypothetical protein GJ496_002531 [Pomphorhynchus laevis]